MKVIDHKADLSQQERQIQVREFAKFFHAFQQSSDVLQAYLECSDEIQRGIDEMIEIVVDPKSDEQEQEMALNTIVEALFPSDAVDLEDTNWCSPEDLKAMEELDREEAAFAEVLDKLMREKRVTQAQLAKKVGVGQPAISNMLKRQCRPQRRTILRLAKALRVAPEVLWPASNDD
jgi:lambda repressor-like predicted transcriptional regulator